MNIDRYHFLPETDVLTTRAPMLHQYCDSYWVVHPEKGLAFFGKGYSHPQCNTNREISVRLCPEWGEIKFFPHVLVPLELSDYQER